MNEPKDLEYFEKVLNEDEKGGKSMFSLIVTTNEEDIKILNFSDNYYSVWNYIKNQINEIIMKYVNVSIERKINKITIKYRYFNQNNVIETKISYNIVKSTKAETSDKIPFVSYVPFK